MKRLFLENILSIIVVFLILTFINALSSLYYIKFDLTSNKKYSLSKSTKEMLTNLKDPVTLNAYFSKNVNPELSERARYLENFLNEMKTYSKNLHINFIDPTSLDQMEKQKLQYEGVVPLQLDSIKNDSYETSIGYLGIVMRSLDKKEVIPALLNEEKAEYELFSKLSLLTNHKNGVVTILNLSNLEKTKDEKSYSFSSLNKSVSELYKVEEFKDSKDPNVIIVLAADKEVTDEELFTLDQYILNGKKVIFTLSKHAVDLSRNNSKEINKKLQEFLKHYGIELGESLVYDNVNARIQIQTWLLPVVVNYPYFIMANSFNKNNVITNSLSGALFPFATAVKFNNKDGLKYESLLNSSRQSFEYSASDLNPTKKISLPDNLVKGPFSLGGIVQGKVESYFKGKRQNIKENGEINLTIFSSIDAIDDYAFSSNQSLFMNAIDNYLDNKDMVHIRNKNITVPNLKPLASVERTIVKYFNIIFAPLVIAAFGIVKYFSRRRKEHLKYETYKK